MAGWPLLARPRFRAETLTEHHQKWGVSPLSGTPSPQSSELTVGLTQTESERSLLPTAQQQYGQLGFAELPFFCFFLKIFGLNF